jgi:diguanylate cyclase (GGDEF)-like protein
LLTINDVSQYKIRERELARMANSDELTGIANRRSFLQAFRSEAERAKRYKKNLSLVLLDLDYFKQINDQYGHAVGDEVLKHFAAEAKKVLREIDILGRVGGEEFAVLMPETDLRSAKRVAERLRKHIANTQVGTERGLLSITFSAGVVAALAGTAEVEGMMRRADDALYEAKHAGRNNVKASVYPYMQQQHLPLSQKAAC